MESVENVSIAPGQMFSRGLLPCVFVYLFVYLTSVRGHVLVKSSHYGVTSRDLGMVGSQYELRILRSHLSLGQIPGCRSIAELQL